MHRFFVPPEQFPSVIGADARQIKDVLRMKPGDRLELLTGDGQVHEAKIAALTRGRVACEIIASRAAASEPKVKITLAQGLPKARKMDLIIEKCVELGVNGIIPMLTERSVAKEAKQERWQKIAKEAAEQAKRAIVPQIEKTMKFQEILKLKDQFDLALIPWELEQDRSLKKIFTDNRITGYSNILIVIGPEGGFSAAEVKLAKDAGFVPVSLGRRILRTETAGLAALAAIMYELE
ncbi:MAG: 16S rRNA (uracil(1498)-N(3))-methyltransferase [Candidatus Saganbacteria bacterium]|nr:16S rRNA (uracil(1498)-N(3))-methyltransferase [Candidatus Saganbacteria bacterium]